MKYTIGIDLGGTNIAAGVVREDFQIIAKAKRKTISGPGREIAAEMAAACREAAEMAAIPMERISSIGVGSPGMINPETGLIDFSPNLHFHQVPLKAFLEEELGRTVYIENDANAAAIGEYVTQYAGRIHSMILITLGTGIGGGFILNGKLFSGFNYTGTEIGHMVIHEQGEPCSCGRNGCFEAYASASALKRLTRRAMAEHPESQLWALTGGDPEKVSGRTAFMGMRAGDPCSTAVVHTYMDSLACGITNIINIFAPEVLCIGGGVSNEGDGLIAMLEERVRREEFARFTQKRTRITNAQLKNGAGIIGAAMLEHFCP
ncbi:MAG TPA: ROK family protein [Firmicutes bacterium]|nr:ROK family protein [Bacillota bacterium]